MVSLTPSQISRLVSCFTLTQSVSLDLVSSKLEKTFVVSAQVFKTTGTASFIEVSRRSCTRPTFHLFPCFEFGLHMRSRSERTSVGCSGSELRSDKAQNSAFKSTSGHRSASSSSYKRGSVSLLGGCSTLNIPIITAFSPPSCATVLHPDDEVLLSFAARTLLYKLRPDQGFLQPGWLLMGRISIVCGLGPVPLRKKATFCVVNQYPLRITTRVN